MVCVLTVSIIIAIMFLYYNWLLDRLSGQIERVAQVGKIKRVTAVNIYFWYSLELLSKRVCQDIGIMGPEYLVAVVSIPVPRTWLSLVLGCCELVLAVFTFRRL